VFLNFFYGCVIDQRALLNIGLKAITDFEFSDCGDQFLGKGVIDAGLDVEAVRTYAGLPGIIAPSTAASRSASSKTIKGAFPPNSRESFFTVEELCFMSRRPTYVEPVKVILRTSIAGHFAANPSGFSGQHVENAGGNPGALCQNSKRKG